MPPTTAKTLSTLASIALLSACSETIIDNTSTTTTPTATLTNLAPGSAAVSGGIFSATSGGTTVTLPASGFTLNGQTAWSNGTTRANSYASASVTAVGGIHNNTVFSGITGTLGTIPTTGSATYTGRYAVNTQSSSNSAPITMSVDYAGGTVSSTGSALTVNGTISGSTVSGTVGFAGKTAPLTGGFYGTNELAGAFSGNDIGGVVYGTR